MPTCWDAFGLTGTAAHMHAPSESALQSELEPQIPPGCRDPVPWNLWGPGSSVAGTILLRVSRAFSAGLAQRAQEGFRDCHGHSSGK